MEFTCILILEVYVTSRSLEHIIKPSHVSSWKRVQRYAKVADRFKISKHQVREIFVDETLHIDGVDYWLWIAYEPNLNKCLMRHLSGERTLFVCYHFFQQLDLNMIENHYLQMECKWYNDARN